MSIPRLTARRLAGALLIMLAVALGVVVLCPLIGADLRTGARFSLLDVGEVWRGLFIERTIDGDVFLLDRMPRVLGAAVVGSGLACAGCAFQAVLRNPLAEPFTLGISSGSSVAAVLAIRLGADAAGHNAIGIAAVAGALLAVYLVFRLGRVGSAHPPATLLLAGITIALFCSAATMAIQYTASFTEVYRMVRWMMGGLDWLDYRALWGVSAATIAGILVLLSRARDLNALSAGHEAAASVGVNPSRTTAITLGAASLIVGAGIALAGPIGFVGLLVPHALRFFVGPDHRVLMPASALCGAALVIVCDTIARSVIAPAQLPVGVVTALLGGPFFLAVLLRSSRRIAMFGG